MTYNLLGLVSEKAHHPGKCPIPHLHGTDESLVLMTEAERGRLRDASNILIDYAYPIVVKADFGKILPASVPADKLFAFRKLQVAYTKASRKLRGLSLFDYDNIYMMFDPALPYLQADWYLPGFGVTDHFTTILIP